MLGLRRHGPGGGLDGGKTTVHSAKMQVTAAAVVP